MVGGTFVSVNVFLAPGFSCPRFGTYSMMGCMEMPKYRHIMEEIKTRVESGLYQVGAALPSERTLAKEFSTNHETANKAISNLVAEGLLFRRRGIGTFVTEEVTEDLKSSLTIDILLYGKASDLFHAASFHEEIVFALQQSIAERGYGCRITPVADVEDFKSYAREAQAFIASKFLPYGHIRTIQEAGIPLVTLNIDVTLPGVSAVLTENQAIDLLCRHLTDLGHTRIAFLRRPGHVATHDLREYRFKNFMQMMELRENLDRVCYIDPDEDAQSGRLVTELRSCTAVVAADDFIAIKLRHLLRRYRIIVPDDLSVTGFGNLSLAKTLFPELTTADVDRESLCKTLVDEAFRLMDGDSDGTTISFASFPVVRRSTTEVVGR